MKVTTKGQVTIPQDIRDRLGIHPGTEVDFTVDGESVKLVRSSKERLRSSTLVEHMRGKGTIKLSTDQILALTRGQLQSTIS